MKAVDFQNELAKHASDADAVFLQKFFKTGKGQYSEGDQFIGVRVPMTRKVCKQFKDLPLPEVQKLLDSPVHEHRLAAVILLANKYPKADLIEQEEIYEMYLANVRKGRINNWDLVDVSAGYVIGMHEYGTDHKILFQLAHSEDLWHKRVSIMSAFYFVMQGDASTTLRLAEILLHDSHDLIQKAVGWQLREVGKRVDRQLLLEFLDEHAATMPRTTLRYAIEHLDATTKKHYMTKKNDLNKTRQNKK